MHKLKHTYILLVISLTLFVTGYGQDIHFSQFTMSPTFINPAAAGTITGDYRGIINFKEQFSSFNKAYQTYKFSYDQPVLRERQFKRTGAGIDVFQDVAGDSKTKMTNVTLSLSQTVPFASYADLTLGVSMGYTQYSADYSNLTWDAQFNGVDLDEGLPTQELFFGRTQGHFDFATGLLYRYFDYNGFPWEIGLAVSHLSRPKLDIVSAEDNLPIKYILHGRKEFEMRNDRIGIIPKFMIAQQRTAREILAGVLVRQDVGLHSKYTGYYKNTTIYYGASIRLGDAIIPEFYLSIKEKFLMGISYDINISNLTVGSRYQGGLEISLSMAGFFTEKYRVASPVTF